MALGVNAMKVQRKLVSISNPIRGVDADGLLILLTARWVWTYVPDVMAVAIHLKI